MNKMKRILALIGAILLIGLYLSTFIFAMIDSELANTLLMVSVSLTIILPILFYGMILMYKLLNQKNNDTDFE